MNLFLSFLIIVEIFTAILAIFSILRKKNYTIAESYCYSTILILAAYSLSIQLFFLLKINQYYYLFDIIILTFSSFQIWKNKKIIFNSYKAFVRSDNWQTNKFISCLLIFISIYLFLQSFLLPPCNWDVLTYNLARVLMFQEEGSLFLKNFSTYRQVIHPWGYDILSFLFLRFYSDFGLGVFSFLSYTVVIAGTYGLVSKIFDQPQLNPLPGTRKSFFHPFSCDTNLILITSFIIASLTGLILQATTEKNDIPLAAVVVVCFLAAWNFYRTFKYFDFYIIIVAALFGLSVKAYFPGFLIPFLIFYTLMLIKQHWGSLKNLNLQKIKEILLGKLLYLSDGIISRLYRRTLIKYTARPLKHTDCQLPFANYQLLFKGALCAIPLGLIFCLIIFWNNNYHNYHSLWGEKAHVDIHINKEGLVGGAINTARYISQAIDLPKELGGSMITKFHDKLLGNNRSAGALYQVKLIGKPFPDEDFSWYGLLGILLIIPAVIYSMIFGKGFIRFISLTLLCFWLILSYKVAWMPWNSRFFSLFFAGSGVCIAFVYQKFLVNGLSSKISNGLKKIIISIAVLTMLYSTLFNIKKPFINIYELGYLIKKKLGISTGYFEGKKTGFTYPGPLIFTWFYYVINRNAYYDLHYHNDVVKKFTNQIKPGKRLLFLAEEDSWNWVFPFLIKRPDLEVIVARPEHIFINDKVYNINKKIDLVFLKKRFDYLLCSEVELIDNIKKQDRIFCSNPGVDERGPVCLYKFYY